MLRSPRFTRVRAGVTCHSHTLGHSITATVTTKSSSVQQVSASVYSISKSGVTRHQLIAAMLGAGQSAADKCAQSLQLWHGKACTCRSQVITKWKLSSAVSSPHENFANTFFCYQKPHFIASNFADTSFNWSVTQSIIRGLGQWRWRWRWREKQRNMLMSLLQMMKQPKNWLRISLRTCVLI